MITSYVGVRRRMAVSLLPASPARLPSPSRPLSKDATSDKRGPAPKLLQQMECIQRLPKAQQRFVMQMIDTLLAQQDR